MAMPTSACASAGASFTPSPVMATNTPRAWTSFTLAALSWGRTSAKYSSSSDLVRHPLGRGLVVAGEHHAADVQRLQRVDGLLRLGPNDVGQGDRAFQLPVDQDEHDGLALRLQWLNALV